MPSPEQLLLAHRQKLLACMQCPNMIGPVVAGSPVLSKILLIGQAPGDKEGFYAKPFAWTAGKTLFKWFEQIGLDEQTFRQRVYMAAVCRCFPGKNPKGGDRVPDAVEISNCSVWLKAEVALLKPALILPVGKLAILQLLSFDKLTEVIGKTHATVYHDYPVDVIPLPHPSGASTWHRTEPGLSLLQSALAEIQRHSVWRELVQGT
ncbi:MAG: uracil-DNA glycosylase family protein [Methylococcaceae bacterium]|nr:uracil-DNA glycosylase family protein [Methylococcaceae bacterium]